MGLKTKKVELARTAYSGVEGRGLKVSARNFLSITAWVGERAEAVITNKPGKPDSNHRVKVKTLKGVRVANVGDWVVKLGKDHFVVVKADDAEKTLTVV